MCEVPEGKKKYSVLEQLKEIQHGSNGQQARDGVVRGDTKGADKNQTVRGLRVKLRNLGPPHQKALKESLKSFK